MKIKTVRYNYKVEDALNPYIGFTSFQHFRNDKLYSDIIVDPANNMTETENVECYPIPDYVPQNGREEGYYPDSTVAYIRVLWKEFEPTLGNYNFLFIEDILQKANSCGQTVMFRLMAHSTRACDDVPDWLKEIIDCPERPDGKRVKDSPTDPRFLIYFSKAIAQIGKRFDGDPRLFSVDISLPGSWGEGHKLHLYPKEDILKLVDVYIKYFPNTILTGQIALPDILNYINEHHPVGWRGDGVGDPYHMQKRYPELFKNLDPQLWRQSPIPFESYWWLGEWYRKGWNIDECIKMLNEWHVSLFNAKSLPIPEIWREKIDTWVNKMGYHFQINSFSCPESVVSGGVLECQFEIENVGVAPIYKKHPLKLLIKNSNKSFCVDTNVDITSWLPGKHSHSVNVCIPSDLPKGEYTIYIGIDGENVPAVYFCTDATREDRYYKILMFTVE